MTMSPKDIEAIYPLSPSQQGMLLDALARPDADMYVEQSLWTITGRVELSAFFQAWQRAVDRHAALRTCFVWQNQKEPLQVVLRAARLSIQQADWQNLGTEEARVRLRDTQSADRQQGFALNKAPLLRLGVFRMAEPTYACLLTIHHLILDGWGLPLLIQDVMAWYRALLHGRTPDLPAITPYRAYIRWLQRQNLTQAENFWRKTLEGLTRPTPLGRIGQSPPAITPPSNYAASKTALSAADTRQIETLARQQRLTLSTIAQGLWAVLLGRYSAQADVLFGATVAGRPADLPGVEHILGMFINTVPVRAQVRSDLRFLEWASTFQQQQQQRQPYEYCSAGQIRQWSAVAHRLPLYDSILVFENYPVNLAALLPPDTGFTFTDFQSFGAQTQYALTLIAAPGSELALTLVVNQRRFQECEASMVLRHLQRLLEAVSADPDIRIADLLAAILEAEIPTIVPYESILSPGPASERIPPRTATEARLLELWQDIFGITDTDGLDIGVETNFFELGGHSLVAFQLITRIRAEFSLDLSLQKMFENPTIAHIAEYIDTVRWLATPSSDAPPDRRGAEEDFEI